VSRFGRSGCGWVGRIRRWRGRCGGIRSTGMRFGSGGRRWRTGRRRRIGRRWRLRPVRGVPDWLCVAGFGRWCCGCCGSGGRRSRSRPGCG